MTCNLQRLSTATWHMAHPRWASGCIVLCFLTRLFQYLSPERARGMPHDTRKSDVWSLGITFFEILVGRTPFEYEEGEVFEKKEDLERYWERTVSYMHALYCPCFIRLQMRGKWVGTYSVSNRVERFLKRMVVPNADLRCTAADLMVDAYWEGSSVSVDNFKTLYSE